MRIIFCFVFISLFVAEVSAQCIVDGSGDRTARATISIEGDLSCANGHVQSDTVLLSDFKLNMDDRGNFIVRYRLKNRHASNSYSCQSRALPLNAIGHPDEADVHFAITCAGDNFDPDCDSSGDSLTVDVLQTRNISRDRQLSTWVRDGHLWTGARMTLICSPK